jgi:hypothetical protein
MNTTKGNNWQLYKDIERMAYEILRHFFKVCSQEMVSIPLGLDRNMREIVNELDASYKILEYYNRTHDLHSFEEYKSKLLQFEDMRQCFHNIENAVEEAANNIIEIEGDGDFEKQEWFMELVVTHSWLFMVPYEKDSIKKRISQVIFNFIGEAPLQRLIIRHFFREYQGMIVRADFE